ncbi:MAG TPA: PAS domain S-box protein [Bryobacteraceae bacterium]|nr:PAS domain S-box protein [Bryobacteraceae bacterium]HOQ45219.1 PAS domain S-box protein [Bryobacteraceae bacterium]HPU71291.1 PAS domain S-box protein [Bryobacteraceae bacterium]
MRKWCHALVDRCVAAVFLVGMDSRIRECNPALARILGYSSPREVVDQPPWECDAGSGAEDLAACLLRHAGAGAFDLRLKSASGASVWLLATAATVEDNGSVLATAVDVTEVRLARSTLARLRRVRAMTAELHRSLVASMDRPRLMQQACRAAVRNGGFQKACIELFGGANGIFEPASYVETEEGFSASTPGTECPEALLLREGRPYICQDIARGPASEPFRSDALRTGLRSAAAFPLHVGGKVAGGFWVFSSEAEIFDSDLTDALKEFASHVGCCLEVRDNIQHAVDRAEARFWELIEAVPDAILETDAHGNILLANAAAEAMFGYTRDELRGRNTEMLVAEHQRAERAKFRAEFATSPAKRVFGPEEGVIARRKDGTEFPCEVSLTPVESRQGNLVTCIVRDITHRLEAERALRESSSQVTSILESITDGFFALDREWRFTYVNGKAEQILGRARSDLIGRVIWEEFPEQSKSVFFEEYRRAMTEKTPVRFSAIFPPAGIWAECHAYPSENGLSVYFQDITERKQLESRIQQSAKLEALGRLAGGVAHDFNNLLTIIGGYANMILESPTCCGSIREDVATILDAANRASTLTRQLLAFSRRQMVRPMLLNLNRAVQRMEKMLRRLIREDIELVLALEPGLDPVKIDPGQLEQVIMNLVVNARDAMPHGGRLTIRTAKAELTGSGHGAGPELPPGRYVVLSVADMGVGMDPAVLSHIFEPFFTTKTKGKGTGLGLATVYGIVKQNGGDILVDTEPGKGSTFRIYFPCAKRTKNAGHAERKTRRSCPSNETILLVEDEPAVRKLASEMLRSQGYRILEAGGAGEALRIWQESAASVDLLLTDVIMPQMNGPQLARKLTAERPELPVLYMSGYTDDVLARHGIAGNDETLLQKPFTLKTLTAKVRRLLDNRPEPDEHSDR